MQRPKGFTLVEAVVVIIILTIMAAIAYPRFIRTMEVTIGREARVDLELILAAEKIIELQSGAYLPCNPPNDCNVELNLDLRFNNWLYDVTVTAPPNPTFLATATRTSGTNAGTEITITENGPPLVGTWPFLNLIQ